MWFFPCVSRRHTYEHTSIERISSSSTKYLNRTEWGGEGERRYQPFPSNEQTDGSGIMLRPHRAPALGQGHPLFRLMCLLAGRPNCRGSRERPFSCLLCRSLCMYFKQVVVCIQAQKCQRNLCPPDARGSHKEVTGCY